MPLLILREEELLDLSGGGARIFIDKRLWPPAEFAVAITARLAHHSVRRDKDCCKPSRQRFLLSPRDRARACAVAPHLL